MRADHLGMCFGVRDAIALARERARAGPLTILGDLVHNETVNEGLRRRGIALERRLEEVKTGTVMITAHGASETAIRRAALRGHRVVEATCPLVARAHRALKDLVEEGYHPVVIGQRDHVEVRGLTEDLGDHDVVLSDEDARGLRERPRFGVVCQTTQPLPKVLGLVATIRRRFPASRVRFEDTVCRPTKERQEAAERLAGSCDVVVVVGGPNSNNTKELAATCARRAARVFRVDGPGDLRPEWLDGARTVGLTAGTSTPDEVIDAVERRLRGLAEPPPSGGETAPPADVPTI